MIGHLLTLSNLRMDAAPVAALLVAVLAMAGGRSAPPLLACAAGQTNKEITATERVMEEVAPLVGIQLGHGDAWHGLLSTVPARCSGWRIRPMLRKRFSLEVAASVVTTSILVLTVVWPNWIELAFRVDPDRNGGWVEWAVVVVCAVATVASIMGARMEWRRHSSLAAT